MVWNQRKGCCYRSERSSLFEKKRAFAIRRDIASPPVGMSFCASPWSMRHQLPSVLLLTVKGDSACLSSQGRARAAGDKDTAGDYAEGLQISERAGR